MKFVRMLIVGAALLATTAQAAVTVNFMQSGADVVVNTTGNLNLTDLTSPGFMNAVRPTLLANPTYFVTGIDFGTAARVYQGFSGPSAIGTGSNSPPVTSSFGDRFGIRPGIGGLFDVLVDPSYVSNALLNATTTFANASLSSLGLTAGQYVYRSSSDTITINVGPPLPPTATIIASLGDFNGPARTEGFPLDLGVVGTFNYTLPVGQTITAAFLEGTFGTAEGGMTAGFDASVDGTTVTVCPATAPCGSGGGSTLESSASALTTFSIALPMSSFAALRDGSADLRLTMTSAGVVRYGTPTLRIITSTAGVPEPATWAMLLFGFGAIGFAMRRRPDVAVRIRLI